VASHLSIPREIRKTSLSEQAGELAIEPARPLLTALKEMTHYHLLVNKYFMLIAISNVFGMLGFYVPFVYLPNMAALKNVSIENANFLLSVIGISNTLGIVFIKNYIQYAFSVYIFIMKRARSHRLVLRLPLGEFFVCHKPGHPFQWCQCPLISFLLIL